MWDGLDPRDADGRERDASDPRDAERDRTARRVHPGISPCPAGSNESASTHTIATISYAGPRCARSLTIGAFRVVPADDLRDDVGRGGDVRHGDLERLRHAGLIRHGRALRT